MKRPYRDTYARLQETSKWVRSPCGRSVLKFRPKISEKFPNTGRAERRHAFRQGLGKISFAFTFKIILKTKCNFFYLKTQFALRSEHTAPRL
jgi:hypothetical protein